MSNLKSRGVSFVACLLSALIVFSSLGINLSAAVTLRDSVVDLYFIDDDVVGIVGSIPSNYKTSYTINPSGSASGYTYRVVSGGSYFQVSDTGVITPKKMTFNYITSSGVISRQEYSEGTGVVRVFAAGTNSYSDITVRTHNYASVYVNNRIQEIANGIKTQYSTAADRVRAITRYVAENYDYSARYSSATSMILYGGGDCWASTDMIIRLAKACGYDAWSRNGNKDSGAGSGHMNALVQTPDGKIYECEAGFAGTKPRSFICTERATLFSYYSYYQNGVRKVAIYQYDGKTVPSVLEIPSTIDGCPVARIDQNFIHSANITSIILPDTLETIGDFAFTQCGITSINIPASVSSIGNGIFADCDSLTSLTVSSSNPYYTSVGNVIYSKDRTTLVTAPFVRSITIPSTVTRIQDYAFYYNDNITSITIPSSVTTIGEGAFGNCTNLSSVTFNEGLTTLGPYVFHSSRNINMLTLPSTVTNISERAFYGMGPVHIVMPGNKAPSVAVGSQNGVVTVSSPTRIFVPTNATGYNTSNWTGNNVTIVRSNNLSVDAVPTNTPTPSPRATNTPRPTNTPTPKPTNTPPAELPAFNPELSGTGVGGFVDRLYLIAMNREVPNDPNGGKAYWVNLLITEQWNGGQVARFFLLSKEFKEKNLTDEQFVEILYRVFFNRTLGTNIRNNYWVTELKNHRRTRENIIAEFINSKEWANCCFTYGIVSGGSNKPTITLTPTTDMINFVSRMYTVGLNKPAPSSAVNYWADELANRRKTARQVAYTFFFGTEIQNQDLSESDFCVRLYRTLLGRDPSYDELSNLTQICVYQGKLAAFNQVIDSTEFATVCYKLGVTYGGTGIPNIASSKLPEPCFDDELMNSYIAQIEQEIFGIIPEAAFEEEVVVLEEENFEEPVIEPSEEPIEPDPEDLPEEPIEVPEEDISEEITENLEDPVEELVEP